MAELIKDGDYFKCKIEEKDLTAGYLDESTLSNFIDQVNKGKMMVVFPGAKLPNKTFSLFEWYRISDDHVAGIIDEAHFTDGFMNLRIKPYGPKKDLLNLAKGIGARLTVSTFTKRVTKIICYHLIE